MGSPCCSSVITLAVLENGITLCAVGRGLEPPGGGHGSVLICVGFPRPTEWIPTPRILRCIPTLIWERAIRRLGRCLHNAPST